MSIRNIIVSILAVAAFSSFTLAQGSQPRQPQPGGGSGGQGMGRGEGRGDGERRMGDGGGFGMRRPGGIDFNRLNLTDAQKQRIQALQEGTKKSWETNQAQFQEMGRL